MLCNNITTEKSFWLREAQNFLTGDIQQSTAQNVLAETFCAARLRALRFVGCMSYIRVDGARRFCTPIEGWLSLTLKPPPPPTYRSLRASRKLPNQEIQSSFLPARVPARYLLCIGTCLPIPSIITLLEDG